MASPANVLKKLFLILIIVQFLMAIGVSLAADDEVIHPAVEAIDKFHIELEKLMRSGAKHDFSTRYEQIYPMIDNLFDFPTITRIIFSRKWKELDTAAQEEITSLFKQLSVTHYAQQFSEYNGEEFSFVELKPTRRGRILVKTTLTTADKEIVSLDYLMHQHADSWRVISVIANGVNDLALKRSEYSDIIKNQGLETLLSRIKQKIADLGKG